MEEGGWAYRRRQPEGTVLYEAVRDHLATLLADGAAPHPEAYNGQTFFSPIPEYEAAEQEALGDG